MWRWGQNAPFHEEIVDDDGRDQFAHDLVQQNIEYVVEMEDPTRHGGHRQGWAPNLDKQRKLFGDHLHKYFINDCMYHEESKFRQQL